MKQLYKRFIFSYIFEWSQLIGKWNWYTFTLIEINFEYEKMTEGLEFMCIILGLGFRIRFNLPASDVIFDKFEKEAKKAIKKHGKQNRK